MHKLRTKDNFEPIRLSDKKATVFTRVLDYAAPVPGFDSPSVNTMIDWEGGGRAIFEMTDKDSSSPEKVPIGMEVEMTFRKLRAAGGIYSYWWKCMPLRESWIAKEEE